MYLLKNLKTNNMNTTEMQYKADTGLSATIDIETEERLKLHSDNFYKIYDMKTLDIFEVKYEDCIRLNTPEYVKWLEEKVNELQKQIK